MNNLTDIRKQKNKLYTELLIAIKEETVNGKKTNEMSLIEAINDSFKNLKRLST